MARKTTRQKGLVGIGIGVALVGAAFVFQVLRSASQEENAYATMRSFSCSQNAKYDTLYLNWRNDTAKKRNPGAFEGGGDEVVLFFGSLSTIKLAEPERRLSVTVSGENFLVVKLNEHVLPIKAFSVNLWRDGVRVNRSPLPLEMNDIVKDVERYLPGCLSNEIAEIEINNGLQ